MYVIRKTYQSPCSITVSGDLASKLMIKENKTLLLQHGLESTEVSTHIESDYKKTFIGVSEDILNQLGLQLNVKYDLLIKDNTIILGPIIGMLVSRDESELELQVKENNLHRYIHFYEQIGGMVIAFSLAGVNKDKNKIKGYLYDPTSNTWKKGVYPFPQAIFNRMTLPTEWRVYFKSLIGNKVFNDFYLNKMKVFELLSLSQDIRKHLPNTVLYSSTSDLYNLLDLHSKVYIKPIAGSFGKGIYKLKKIGKQFSLSYKKEYIKKNKKRTKYIKLNFQSWDLVRNYLSKTLRFKKYIIQQGIDTSFQKHCITDFRMILVKDKNGDWQDIWLYGRTAKNSIVSNRTNGGILTDGEETLKRLFKINDSEVTEIRKKIANIVISGAKMLDSKHHYGHFGVDIAVDKNKYIWILEYNNRDPNHYAAKHAGRMDIVYNAYLSNLLYAKYLAGFVNKG
ncbi:YheC/YheD family protein [Niallia sp. XMNu-256]|uniref:YheC/YheD family endospore coat-associated protein n=1 Tax=Niallia sp. XMNu-256 TaxID=3082444 RepID=UPI0030D27482